METLAKAAIRACKTDDHIMYWKNATPYHKEVLAARKALQLAIINYNIKTMGR